MSVSNETARIAYTASDGETVFNFTNILIFQGSDLKVYKNGVLLDPSAYSVTLNDVAPADGFITLTNPVVANDIVIIERDIPLTQITTYNPGTAFPAKSHENALDRRALSDNDLALEARYRPGFARGRNQNIDWAYTNLPDETETRIPIFDPTTKTILWVNADVLNTEGGVPASVDFSAITGTLDISGSDVRILDFTLPYGGAVPLNLSERFQVWYTVKDFGALGDDATDDSTAFTNCEAASGLGWVYVPSGTYRLSSNVNLTNVVIATGAVIKPDTGVTVTITGSIVTGFSQIFDGLGSVKITKQRPLFIEWFGGIADGVTDNIAAFDKTIAAAENNTCSIQLLNGTYIIGSSLNLNLEGIALAGMGRNNTTISSSIATGNDIVISSNNSCYLGDFKLQPSATKTSGNGILVSAGNDNKNSEFVGLDIVNAYNGINFLRASAWVLHHCRITNPVNIGIVISNEFNTQDGSGRINNCIIEKTAKTGIGIFHASGGDVTINNSRFSQFDTGYLLQPPTGVIASNLIIQGCIIEDANKGIDLNKVAGTGIWSAVNINNNTISNCSTAGVRIPNNISGWLSQVNIDGNIIRIPNGAIGVDIDGQDSILIDSNIFDGISGTTTATDTGAAVTSVEIGAANIYRNISNDQVNAATGNESVHNAKCLYGSAAWDPGSLAQSATTNTTVTVTGAQVGMWALATFDSLTDFNLILTAVVSSANTVTVSLYNISSASPVDLAAGTLRVVVFDPIGAI